MRYTKCIFEALLVLMRKAILFFVFIALPFLGKAQSKSITIDWGNSRPAASKIEGTESSSTTKQKAKAALKLQLNKEAISYQTKWEDAGFADKTSVTLTNVRYGSVSAEELNLIDTELVPDKLEYYLGSSHSREKLFTLLKISPIIKTNSGYKKVLSFDVDYRYGPFCTDYTPDITNSVLASGKWYKFKVAETGIHKIDRSFLSSLGMNVDGINPRNIKIYGFGGKSLPLLNEENKFFDLPEIAIQVVGEEDGSFDGNDYILFYGTSTNGYVEENDSNLNPYTDDSFYYVTVSGDAGKRVRPMVEPTGTVDFTISEFDDYQFYEKDEESPTKLGRKWFGNRFDINNEQSFNFEFPNIVSSKPIQLTIKTAAASESATSMAVTVNSTSLDPIEFRALGVGGLLDLDEYRKEIPASSETVQIDLSYNNAGNPSSIAYLDYIGLWAVRTLSGAEGQLPFRYNAAETLTGVGEYQITNAAQFSQVWDVTDSQFITSKQNENNASSFSFKQTLGQVREYVAVGPSNYLAPVKVAQPVVQNQNLKGTIFKDGSGNFRDVDYLIITAPFLIQPALRLATYHKNLQGLNVKVVTTDKIYEEFSGGSQDISAIRNFVRYVYNNASTEAKRVKYVGILGDASIDYKNRLANNNNIVPTFQTLTGVSIAQSFMSDDFFGNMDPCEGTIGSGTTDIDLLDIAMGRIIADNVSMANAMVDKIIKYTSESSYGNWRTNFVLISDDIDEDNEEQLQLKLDALGDQISMEKPFINVKKIHTDAYQQEASAGGSRYPEVNEAIKSAFDVGAIIIDYFGHGGEDGLAAEYIYTKETAQNLRNKDNLPCVVTVTCEFTKFDNPLRITAGELTYLNKEGGAISLVTTTRAIYINTGVLFNQLLADNLFGYGRDVPETPAEGLRLAKQGIDSDLRRVVFYIGDPAMHLAFPKKSIRITRLNDVPIGQATDTLKALSKIKLAGEVINEAGMLMADYNGILEAKVFDKNVMRQTLDNDNFNFIMDFTTLGESLFNGKATIANGLFEFEFVVPRDIQIPVGKGRVSLYAKRNNELEDQAGVNLDIDVGGLNENAPEDNEGPLIKLFMNDESFVSGGITDDSPMLLAKLEDTNGINTASGIGHDIVAILDGDESNPFVLNEFYQADVDDYTKGKATFKFRDLEDGLHTLTLKAWDVYNNSSTAEIQFIVAGNDKLEITRVLNYPNPFVNYTQFWFNHNRPDETLDVQVQVFTVTGKVVWTKNATLPPSGSYLCREITWDGRDDFGDRIGKGVYVYKITVNSALTNQRVEKFEKLVIL
ncbi:type IX secretion system sortase PorU [Aequorivita flava]|uniref:Type IX secretion system sortase PorU n=2 Tax=Aequorivita flava TaxID=3114371 RepID=A0AB35YR53_9FLAO